MPFSAHHMVDRSVISDAIYRSLTIPHHVPKGENGPLFSPCFGMLPLRCCPQASLLICSELHAAKRSPLAFPAWCA